MIETILGIWAVVGVAVLLCTEGSVHGIFRYGPIVWAAYIIRIILEKIKHN